MAIQCARNLIMQVNWTNISFCDSHLCIDWPNDTNNFCSLTNKVAKVAMLIFIKKLTHLNYSMAEKVILSC